MAPRRLVLLAGLIASVATVQLIMNVAGAKTGSEPQAKVTSSVEIAPAPAPSSEKAPVAKKAPASASKAPELEMSVTEVTTTTCPDKKSAKTRLGLLEKSSVHSVCP